jgi:hypothetical protein
MNESSNSAVLPMKKNKTSCQFVSHVSITAGRCQAEAIRCAIHDHSTRLLMTTKLFLLAASLLIGSLSARAETFNYGAYDDLPGTSMPAIIEEPSSQTVSPGSNLVLTVTATGDFLNYQWEHNGDIIPGATNQTLTITSIDAEACGAYRVAVFNGTGFVKSKRAFLGIAVQTLPFSDAFASQGSITTAYGRGTGNSQAATKEAGEPTPGNPRVGKSVWLTWIAPANGIALFKSRGSGFDTVLAAYTGNTLGTLVQLASDDDADDVHSSIVAFNATAGATYRIYVGSLDQDGGPILLTWSMLPATWPWPTSVVAPSNVTTLPGGSATMTVQFQSTKPLTIQWYLNGQPILNATNASLQWSQLTEADLGTYQVSLSSPNWTWFVKPAEIQFNSTGIATAGARNKLVQALP